MSAEIKIPAVGESIVTGYIAQWHKATGDQVAVGDLLLTLETDKISTEIAAEEAGVLEIIVPEGEEVPIGASVGRIGKGVAAAPIANAAPAAAPIPAPVAAPAAPAPAAAPIPTPVLESVAPAPVVVPVAAPVPVPVAPQPVAVAAPAPVVVAQASTGRKAPVSPVVKRLAKENGVDLSRIVGTGKRGAILKKDVQAYIDSGGKVTSAPVATPPTPPTPPAPAAVAPAPAASPAPQAASASQRPDLSIQPAQLPAPVAAKLEDSGRVTRKRLSPLRRKIATQLVAAQQNAALLTTFNECDMSAVMKLRKDVQEDFVAKHGVKLGFMSLFIKAVVDALKEVPAINARMDGEDLILNHFFDVGVAVGTERGLVVPVIRDCDQKSFAEIEKDIIGYATKARDGKLQLADLQGGVFTISNGGIYGSMLSTPILNPPQSGILGMHNIMQRPMAVDGEVVVRPMMYLALSYDHRIVDGKEAVTFLVRVKDCIENPARLLVGA
jgi:2-oxoglutarate dehydrogenase E2 component (dihydrolipoamide succinyltransferase)